MRVGNIRSSTICCLFLLVSTAFPQGERATISGTVSDNTQAIIPGVKVSLKNVATNIMATTESNSAGIYVFPSLSPGSMN